MGDGFLNVPAPLTNGEMTMTVKLPEFPVFNADAYKGQETHDPLGSYISRFHRIVEEHMQTPNGERVWGVQCVRCKHGYIVASARLSTGNATQPCRCTQRKGYR